MIYYIEVAKIQVSNDSVSNKKILTLGELRCCCYKTYCLLCESRRADIKYTSYTFTLFLMSDHLYKWMQWTNRMAMAKYIREMNARNSEISENLDSNSIESVNKM